MGKAALAAKVDDTAGKSLVANAGVKLTVKDVARHRAQLVAINVVDSGAEVVGEFGSGSRREVGLESLVDAIAHACAPP